MPKTMLIALLGVSLAALLVLHTSKLTQRRALIGAAVLSAAIAIPALWQSSMQWRVRNAPTISTAHERETVAAIDQIRKDLERLSQVSQSR